MALELAAPPRRISTAVHRVDGAAVLVLTGRLDRADPAAAGSSAEAALTAVEACLSDRPVGVVVDVSRVELSRFTVGLLGLVRGRTSRVRVPLLLADVPIAGQEVLERSGVADLYPAFPSISSALESLGARPAPAV